MKMEIGAMPQIRFCGSENNAIFQIRRIRRRISIHTTNILARRIRFVGEHFSGTINIISSAYISRRISKTISRKTSKINPPDRFHKKGNATAWTTIAWYWQGYTTTLLSSLQGIVPPIKYQNLMYFP